MPSLIDRVRRSIYQHGLLPSGSRVVVGLSGGADSVALAVLLNDLAAGGEFEVARLAHLHHGLRGSAADEDEAFCRTLAGQWSLPIEIERVDVRALAQRRRRSLEEAGREARYQFFDRVADMAGADRIAVGHTLEDQAETFLLHLLRGAGSRGLGGMSWQAGRVVRPLLDVRHAELREYLAERGLTFREDETNQDTRLLRNRLRHVVIPFLEEQVSPGVAPVLARSAAIARDDDAWLEAEAARAWERTARVMDGAVELDCAGLAQEPLALSRRTALRALEAMSGGRFVGFDQAEMLLSMIRTDGRDVVRDLPGVRAERRGPRLTLRARAGGERGRVEPTARFCYELSIPGTALVVEAGARITAALEPAPGDEDLRSLLATSQGRLAVLDSLALGGGLRVRSRQPGDRFRPLGLSGTKKLQDFFVDRKVPEAERDRAPLVVDEADRIVWVAGHAISGDFRVTARSTAVVILKLESWGDGV